MYKTNVRSHRLLLISLIMALALVLGACDNNDGAVVVDDPVVAVPDTEIVEEDVVVDVDAEVTVEADAEAEIVSTEVATQLITDTEVITQTEVITAAVVTEVITETNVSTDVREGTIVGSDVTTETEDLGLTTSPVRVQGSADQDALAGFMIFVVTDAEGNEFLADASNERPIFAQSDLTQAMIEDGNFEPIGVDENISVSADLDQTIFGVRDQDGFQQLTVNEYPVYRFVGDEAELQMLTLDWGLTPLTREGELGELGE